MGCAKTTPAPPPAERAAVTQPSAQPAQRQTAPYVPTMVELQRAVLLARVNSGVRVGTTELIPEPRGGPRARGSDSEMTLHWAARERPEWVGRLLDRGCELEARDVLGRTPLHEALFTGHDDAARLLIKRGADVKAVDPYGATTVILAARLCQAELVRELLDDGVDPNARSSSGASALVWALLRDDDLHVAKLLISRGADVNVKDAMGHSLLHWVCAFGSVRAADYLIERGVASNGVDQEGITPLHVAAWRGRPELARLLVAAGADPNASTTEGETPLDWARSNQNSETEAELARLGGVAGDKSNKPGDATRPEER